MLEVGLEFVVQPKIISKTSESIVNPPYPFANCLQYAI